MHNPGSINVSAAVHAAHAKETGTVRYVILTHGAVECMRLAGALVCLGTRVSRNMQFVVEGYRIQHKHGLTR